MYKQVNSTQNFHFYSFSCRNLNFVRYKVPHKYNFIVLVVTVSNLSCSYIMYVQAEKHTEKIKIS